MIRRLAALCLVAGSILPASSVCAADPSFALSEAGSSEPIDYERYGRFTGVGTDEYLYSIEDLPGLAAAAGEGVYPSRAHEKDPSAAEFALKSGSSDPWKHVRTDDPQSDFYAWCLASDVPEGVKLFHIGEALRRAGHLEQALKAFHALVVHFPRDVVWSADGGFYWYAAPEAISRIRKICAEHPELGLELVDAFVDVDRAPEKDPARDRVTVWPGRFVRRAPEAIDPATRKITARRGEGRVRLVQYDGKDWQLLKDGEPFVVRGVTYTSTTVGESAHAINLRPWMRLDDDKNGRNDGMFDSWVDADGDNVRDAGETAVGDARLLQRMGANALRVYHGVDAWGNYDPKEYDKHLMRRLALGYGIHFILGDFLGAYTLGSQANWDLGTDYTDEEQKKRMLAVLKDMVLDHKDEPYTLMWLLGNENQHAHTHTNAHKYPEAYARFLNEAAAMIHELDPDHPVAVCNLNVEGLKEIARYAPEIDIYGANVYSGAYSMGSVWQRVRRLYDRPVMITEMGCDAYAEGRGPDEEGQADYFAQNWADVLCNAAGARGEGNSIGGVFFEWMDEWWKTSKGDSWGNPQTHDTAADFPGPFPDGQMHEEWLGIFGQGDGRSSPFLREPRKVYETLRRLWAEPDGA